MTFLTEICIKMGLGLEFHKINVGIKINILEITLRANFPTKRTTLTFSAQIWPKIELELEIQKTNVRSRINILEIP